MRLTSHQEFIGSLSALAAGSAYAQPERRRIVILFTPYAGNSVLADLLTNDGRFGLPNEYFNHDVIRAVLPELGAATEIDYLNGVETFRASPEGVFTLLITMGDIARFDSFDFFDRHRQASVVYLRRRNIVEQAIALYLSQRLELSDATRAGGPLSESDEAALALLARSDDALCEIKDWCAHILNYEMSAEVEIAKRAIVPLRIFYEELVADPARVLGRLHALIGAAGFAGAPPRPLGDEAVRFMHAELHRVFLGAYPDFMRSLHAIRPPLTFAG